jgi:predicted amidophosphoribosyltransferase
MEKNHDLSFCPQCGAKLEGDEFICSTCGFKLAYAPQTTVLPPVVPVTPPPVDPVMSQEPLKKLDFSFCPECGTKLDGDEIICPVCGYKLSKQAVNQVVSETPVIPPQIIEQPIIQPPVFEEAPIAPTPIVPIVEEPVVVETPVEQPPVVKELIVPEKKHTLTFCPQCGQKLEGDEVCCPKCGYNLLIAPPVSTGQPVVPPTQPVPPYNQPVYGMPVKKKKTGLVIFLILLFVIILGCGTVAFLQYNGNITIAFLENIIPQKSATSDSVSVTPVTNHTRYYVCHSIAAVGTRMTVIVSNTIVSKKPYNNKDGAVLEFKKAISIKYPKEYSNFTIVLCDQYKTFTEATSGHSTTIKNYGAKKYDLKTVDVKY